MRLPPKRRALAVIVPVANVRRFFGNHRSPARSPSPRRMMFFQPPPTAAVAPSSRAPPAPLSRLRADFCSFCWTFSVVLVSYRKNFASVSSREPSRRRRSRATLEVPFSRGDWETWGGSPEATSPSPGTGARRRDVSGVAPLARPCPRRLGGLESPDGVSGGAGQRIAPRIVPYARIVSTKDDVGRRVGNGGRRRTLGVDAAVHYLRRAHDTTRSTPSEEEGVQRPAPRARDCFVANSALTIQSFFTFSERFGNRQNRPKRGVRPTNRYVCVAVSDLRLATPAWHSILTFRD